LRERREDILPLAGHALARMGDAYRRPKRLLPAAEAVLLAHPWPGNVRELANLLERVRLLHDGEEIGPDDLGLATTSAPSPAIATRCRPWRGRADGNHGGPRPHRCRRAPDCPCSSRPAIRSSCRRASTEPR